MASKLTFEEELKEPLWMTQIVPDVWLGSEEAATDVKWLDHHKIFHILSIREESFRPFVKAATLPDRTYHRIWCSDKSSADLAQHFETIIRFIDDHKPVLVNCRAGISRSATAVAAYLIYKHRLKSANEAIEMICRTRIVSPNDGFERQLEHFAILQPYLYWNTRRSKRFRKRK